jgi:hypothetical protein
MINSCAAIVIAAKHGELIKVKDTSGITHTIGTLRCKFEFRTSDWNYTARTAVFCKGNMATNPSIIDSAIGVILDNVDECAVPPEVLLPEEKYFSVGVWGTTKEGLRIVSKWLVFRIEDGCYVDSSESITPTPSVYEQIIAELSSKASKEYIDNKLENVYMPTKVSQLENDEGYLSSIPDDYITENELNSKGYLTEHQSLEDYAKKTDIPDLSKLEEKIDNLDKTKLNSSSLDDTIDKALKQAKTSGEFDGKDGVNGKDGADGLTPFIAENGNWWIGSTDIGVKAKGTDGINGTNGVDGKDGTNGIDGVGISNVEIINNELAITLTSGIIINLGNIKGADGINGKDGVNGTDGKDGANGKDGIGISLVDINADGKLVVTFSDETELVIDKIIVGENGIDGKDGTNGKDGADGYTPIKGVDYFDGKDGYTPTKGVDYYTETEKQELVNEISEDISNEGYVKNTDYASDNIAGIVKVKTNTNSHGIKLSNDKILQVACAEKSDIKAKANYTRPIVPVYLEYAVEVCTNQDSDAELTEAQLKLPPSTQFMKDYIEETILGGEW